MSVLLSPWLHRLSSFEPAPVPSASLDGQR